MMEYDEFKEHVDTYINNLSQEELEKFTDIFKTEEQTDTVAYNGIHLWIVKESEDYLRVFKNRPYRNSSGGWTDGTGECLTLLASYYSSFLEESDKPIQMTLL